jgi:hypothetical protein
MLRKTGALLLAVVLALTGVFVAPAYADTTGNGASLFSAGKIYAVPLTTYINYTMTPPTSARIIQFNEAAMVARNQDGTLHVTLRFNSYSFADAVQIVKPEKVADAVAQYSATLNGSTANMLPAMPMGTKGFETDSVALHTAMGNAWASADFNDWFMDGVTVEGGRNDADRDMDLGYLSFDIDESALSQRLMVRAFSFMDAAGPKTVVIAFSLANAAEIPTDIATGERVFGLTHGEVLSASSDPQFQRNGSSYVDIVEGTLNTTASALVCSNGETAVHVGLGAYTTGTGTSEYRYTVHAVQRAVFRSPSFENGDAAWSEVRTTQYEDIATEDNAFTYVGALRLEDMIFGIPFKFTCERYRPSNNTSVYTWSAYTWIRLLPLPGEDYTTASGNIVALADGAYTVPATLTGAYSAALGSAALNVSGGAIAVRLSMKELSGGSRVAAIANIGGGDLTATPAAAALPYDFDFLLPAGSDGKSIPMNLTLADSQTAEAHTLTLDFAQAISTRSAPVYEKNTYVDFTNGNDLKLSARAADAAGKSPAFSAAEIKHAGEQSAIAESSFNSRIGSALTEEDYKVYLLSFVDQNNENATITPTGGILEFTPPDFWELGKINVSTVSMTGGLIDHATLKPVLDFKNGKMLIPIRSDMPVYYFFVYPAVTIDPTALEDGLYKARVLMRNNVAEETSMSDNAVDHTAYIEKSGASTKLYMSFGVSESGGFHGMIRDMYRYGNTGEADTPVRTEHLAYTAHESGELVYNYVDEDILSIRRVVMDLAAPTTDTKNTYYRVRFDIPLMDAIAGTPGDYSGSRDARLFVISAEKVADGVNPLAGYDKSVIRAKIDEAQRLVATLNAATDGARIEELAAAILTAQVAYNNVSLTSEQIKEARDALAAVVGTTGGGTPGEGTPEPEDQDDAALAPGDYPADIKLWNFSGNYASMGNGALAHDQSFIRVKADGAAEAHLFFKALTFTGLTGHLERIFLVTDLVRDEYGIVQNDYKKDPATVVSDYAGTADATDEFGPIDTSISAYPREVVIPVEIGKTYTTVEVFVPVMEKAVGGAGTQLARLQIDWSALGVDEPPPSGGETTSEPPAAKAPEATETITVVPEIKSDAGSADGKTKIVENTVTSENKEQIVSAIGDKASDAVNAAKTSAEGKIAAGAIAAGETVVAEVRIDAKTSTPVSEIKQTVINIPAAAITAALDAATDSSNNNSGSGGAAGSAKVELVLTVESDLAAVTLDSKELAALVQGKGDDAIVSVTVVTDARAAEIPLPEAQANAVPANKAPFAIELTVDNAAVTGTLASEIAVTIPYVKQGADKKVVLWYVSASGERERVNSAAFANGKLTFTTDKI